MEINIVIPAYNEEAKIERAILSAINQKHNNFEVWVYDDGSTDDTYKKAFAIKHDNLFVVPNKHMSSPSHYFHYHSCLCDKDIIIVHLDADDYLYNDNVLNVIEQAYTHPDIWMTYGQFITDKGDMGFCGEVKNTRTYRDQSKLLVSHLRTHKAGLMWHVNEDDLKDGDGKYYETANDLSFIYPMVEMCGNKHMKFINEILYLYDTTDPTCTTNEQLRQNYQRVLDIKGKPKYNELKQL